MPWEKDWGAVQTSVPPTVKKEDKGGILPWLKDWASEQLGNSPKTTQKRSTIENQGAENTNPLDSVFKSLLQAESGSRHVDENGKLIISGKGAQGITQLMPSTAKKPGFGIEPVKDQSEAEYLRVGKSYLSALHGKYGDWEQALAAYNAGPGNVDKAIGKANRYGGDWKDYLPVKEETIPYINKILGDKSASK